MSKYTVYLNTGQRTSGGHGDPEFILNRSLTLTNDSNWFEAKVESATIPFSFKMVNASNGTVTGNLAKFGGVNQNFDFTIPPGNYNITDLLDVLGQALAVQIASLYFGLVLDYTFTYDKSTGKVSFILNNNPVLTPEIKLNFGNNDIIGKMIGMSGTLTINGTLVYSTNHVNVSPVKCLYVRSESFAPTNVEALLESSIGSDILARIPISTAPNSYIVFDGGNASRITDKKINVIGLYITTDQSYIPIDTDGLEINLTLSFAEISSGMDTNINNRPVLPPPTRPVVQPPPQEVPTEPEAMAPPATEETVPLGLPDKPEPVGPPITEEEKNAEIAIKLLESNMALFGGKDPREIDTRVQEEIASGEPTEEELKLESELEDATAELELLKKNISEFQ